MPRAGIRRRSNPQISRKLLAHFDLRYRPRMRLNLKTTKAWSLKENSRSRANLSSASAVFEATVIQYRVTKRCPVPIIEVGFQFRASELPGKLPITVNWA